MFPEKLIPLSVRPDHRFELDTSVLHPRFAPILVTRTARQCKLGVKDVEVGCGTEDEVGTCSATQDGIIVCLMPQVISVGFGNGPTVSTHQRR